MYRELAQVLLTPHAERLLSCAISESAVLFQLVLSPKILIMSQCHLQPHQGTLTVEAIRDTVHLAVLNIGLLQ